MELHTGGLLYFLVFSPQLCCWDWTFRSTNLPAAGGRKTWQLTRKQTWRCCDYLDTRVGHKHGQIIIITFAQGWDFQETDCTQNRPQHNFTLWVHVKCELIPDEPPFQVTSQLGSRKQNTVRGRKATERGAVKNDLCSNAGVNWTAAETCWLLTGLTLLSLCDWKHESVKRDNLSVICYSGKSCLGSGCPHSAEQVWSCFKFSAANKLQRCQTGLWMWLKLSIFLHIPTFRDRIWHQHTRFLWHLLQDQGPCQCKSIGPAEKLYDGACTTINDDHVGETRVRRSVQARTREMKDTFSTNWFLCPSKVTDVSQSVLHTQLGRCNFPGLG